MKSIFFGLLFFFVNSGYSQSAAISRDSLQIIFPSSVTVRMSPIARDPKGFRITSQNLTVLMTEINFLLNRLQLEQKNVVYFRANEEVMKSMLVVSEKKYMAELERTLLHKNAFENLQQASERYREELDRCRSDLEDLNEQKRKSGRGGFVRGMVWGIVIGGVVGILVDAAVR